MEMPRSLFSESLRAPLPASSAYGSPKHPTGRLRRKKAKKNAADSFPSKNYKNQNKAEKLKIKTKK